MEVKLVGYTQPSEEFKGDFSSVKDLIAYCARVSNPSNQFNTETTDKLINYLLKHKHFSPFEMASATIEITTTRDIARQILRHRSFTFQEWSQRYADPTKDLGFVIRETRRQDHKNRQNSLELDDLDIDDYNLDQGWRARQLEILDLVKKHYIWAIENGIAKEQARAILPEGNTKSRMYMQGTIRSFIHYIELRREEGTQKEHREVALAVAKALNQIFPV